MTKHAFAPYLISPVKDSIKIFAISDKYENVKATVEIMLVDFDGKILKQDRKDVVIEENSSTEVYGLKELDWVNETNRRNVVLSMKLWMKKESVSTNKYYFEKSKVLNLPKVKFGMKQTVQMKLS
jgi:beta-mannosidase